MWLILLGMTLSGTTGCVSSLWSGSSPKSSGYHVNPPPAPWQVMDTGGADVAYRHPADAASMSVNSVCGQYQNLGLEDLTKQLFVGLNKPQVLTQRPLVVHGLAGLETRLAGHMEGRAFDGLYTVLRSPRCVYDVMLVAQQGGLAAHEEDYHAVVNSFQEKGQP